MTQPKIGVCYYPEHWPEEMWAADAAAMREAGISVVRIGEFAWSRLEPEPGRLAFDWLARAIDTLAGEGLKVILGTPTATPPKWLVDAMPDMVPVDRNGRARGFGSRRHYDFSHPGYRAECARIVRALAERFGRHPAVIAWQTDNEYGCHNTTRSFSPAALGGFRRWLKDRYGTIEALNDAWGTVFWSMEYRGFEEVDLPVGAVTELSPPHRLDFRRYSSDQVRDFNRVQTEILRELSPGRDLVHNFMVFFTDFDPVELSRDLDVASWDSYPLGTLDIMPAPPAHKQRFARAGDPDVAAFHHDLYRACGRGRLWIMEQQPGPVNWAPYNLDPHPGMVRLWGWEAFAHGAELVSYFRWRQAPFAQEQFHAGLNLPDGTPDRGLAEATQLAREIETLGDIGEAAPAKAAILYSYDSQWALGVQPQGQNFFYLEQAMASYRHLRSRGLDVDIVSADDDLDGYELLIVPSLVHVPDALAERLAAFAGKALIWPRTGSRTVSHQIPGNLAPGPLADWLKIRVLRTESFRGYAAIPVTFGNEAFAFDRWREIVEGGEETLAETVDGHAAILRTGGAYYLAGWPDEAMYARLLDRLIGEAGLQTLDLPEGVRTRRRGNLRFLFNYNPEPVDLSGLCSGAGFVLGSPALPVAGVAAYTER